MKIMIIGGFLGSGKTSVILQLAHYLVEKKGLKVAILENEIGEIGIDDKILEGSGLKVRGLFAGCVCCTLAGELPLTVMELQKEETPDVLIVESTGVAFPYSIAENLKSTLDLDARVISLADASRWMRIFRAMENLLRLQLQDADLILLNKTDLLDEAALSAVTASVSSVNGDAEILPVSAKQVLSDEILEQIAG